MSIPFQKFQRYAHGELDLSDYLDFLGTKSGEGIRAFSLYGNDAEIFDFRPGRFHTEAALGRSSEWERIGEFYRLLRDDNRFELIRPGQVLDLLDRPGAGQRLRLESAAQPIPVKKQPKYNVLRWAVSGRDNLGINTSCWRIFASLSQNARPESPLWKELCYLWSSDFRTHITKKRWLNYKRRLRACLKQVGEDADTVASSPPIQPGPDLSPFHVARERDSLWIETPALHCRLSCRRGLAILSLGIRGESETSLVGTLEHGYFDDILYGADFYTGHLVFEIPGQHKITDLQFVNPEIGLRDGSLVIRGTIATRLGPLIKEVVFHPREPSCEISYLLDWQVCPNGSLRFGHITLNPERFAADSLWFQTQNGGGTPETFHLSGAPVDHLAPVSSLVSANQGLGVTGGWVAFGDRSKEIRVEVAKSDAAVTGHIVYAPVGDRYLYRLVFSAQELDDTGCHISERPILGGRRLALKVRFPGG